MVLAFFVSLFLFQGGDQISQTRFQMERSGLKLEPAKMAVLLDEQGPPLVFSLSFGGGELGANSRFKAQLVGPGLAAPHAVDVPASSGRIVLERSLLAQEGAYRLLNVRLETSGQTVAFAEPKQAEIQVAENFVVSEVQVKPLSQQDLIDRGYLFSQDDYFSVEFSLALTIGSQEETITVPVAYPKKATDSFEPIVLEDPFKPYVRMLAFKRYPDELGIPPGYLDDPPASQNYIPGLILIPGNFNYLRSHFEVTCLVLNAAPEGFDVKVDQLQARLKLPDPGVYGHPLSVTESVQKPMLFSGADHTLGTDDDRPYILPGEKAEASYVVIGNIPGMYDVEIEVHGKLSLQGEVKDVTTVSKGQIFVRAPEFSADFDHPDAVAQDEAYDLRLTITNRGEIPLEGFSITLDPDELVGVRLNNHPVQSPGSIPVGGSGTVVWNLTALISGRVISSYYKADGDVPGALHLRTGVGDLGQKFSPFVLHFPQIFYDAFGNELGGELRRLAKTALDFSQMRGDELPLGQPAVSPSAVREFNTLITGVAKSSDYGASEREQWVRLLELWTRSVREYAPLDTVRRSMISSGLGDQEGAFARLFQAKFAGVSDTDVLIDIAREVETAPNLFAVIVQTSGPAQVRMLQGDKTNEGSTRAIPFATMLSLGSNRTLLWVSGADETPVIRVTPLDGAAGVTAQINALFPSPDGKRHLLAAANNVASGAELRLDFDPSAALMRALPAASAPLSLRGIEVAPKTFSLALARQADPKLVAGADSYGRDFVFSFSRALDLASLDPIEEHLFINGEPAVDAVLQTDGRTLIASSRMPLGPYFPIAYEIRSPKARDGQSLADQVGVLQGSSWYTGVSVLGRIVDRNASDLKEAVVFHFRFVPDEGWLVFDQTKLDENGEYLFEFSPYQPFAEDADKTSLKIGVLLADGRYEEREFFPRGAGQRIVADFAFLQQGEVRGRVTSLDGTAVVNAVVYAVNQNNDLSAVLTQTDPEGYYRASGLEVGPILVKSSYQGIVGYASSYLTQTNSPLTIDVVVNNPSAAISGVITVNQSGTLQPREGVFVAFLLQNGLAATLQYGNRSFPYTTITQTAADGSFHLDDAPAGNGFFWVFDPYYGYFERLITLSDGEAVTLNHSFDNTPQPTGTVTGYVKTNTGFAVEGARVSADGQSTVTNSAGYYELPFLTRDKTHTLSASHRDYGGGSAGVDLDRERIDGINITLLAPIQLSGRYEDENGNPIPYAFIYKPPYGFVFRPLAQTDAFGNWHATINETGTFSFTSMDTPKIAAVLDLTITEAGANNIVLRQWPTTSLRVRLVDESGNPVVGKVDLKSMKPSPFTLSFGIPYLTDTHIDFFTDTQGELVFNNLNIGAFEVFGHTGQLGETEVYRGTLEEVPQGGQPQTITLVFPTTLEPANLFGKVFDIDGVSPAPQGTIVQVKGPGIKASVFVDALGQYRFDSLVKTSTPVRLSVIASHPDQGVYDTAFFDLHQDLNFRYDLSLKRQGTANVRIINGDGTPADYAAVQVSYRDVTYVPPLEGNLFGELNEVPVTETAQITPSQQVLSFHGIPQGEFTIRANTGNGLVGLRAFVIPTEDRELDVTVQLEASSSISGSFLDHADQPIVNAEIQLKEANRLLQQRLTEEDPGTEGQFLFDNLPMRDYSLHGVDPSNAFEANLAVTTSPYQPNPNVTLRLDPLGHLEGVVYWNGQPVPNAYVEVSGSGRKIITGSDSSGTYRFRNLPLGNYSLKAESPAVLGKVNTGVTLSEAFATKIFDINFGEVRDVDLYVESSDGGPAANVLVTAENLGYAQVVGNSAYTDANGVAHLRDLPLGTYRVSGQHPTEVVHLDGRFTITEADQEPIQRSIAFLGYGQIHGIVHDTTGQILNHPVHVNIRYIVNYTRIDATITTDESGAWRIGRIPVSTPITITAYNQETQEVATASLQLSFHGEDVARNLSFRTSTYVSGTVRYADGSPAVSAEVWITQPYYLKVTTDSLGEFFLRPVLEGQTILNARDAISQRQAAVPVEVTVANGLPVPISGLNVVLSGVASVTGHVSYSDGDLLRSGSVVLEIPALKTTLTTLIFGDGSYRFDQVPLGAYRIYAHDRKFDKDTATLDASTSSDGELLNLDLAFEPSYQLTGRVLAADGITPIDGGLVELWRPRPNQADRYDLIYAGSTNQDGYYAIDHVYPGPYRIAAEDAALEGFYESSHLQLSQAMNRNIQLVSRSWLLGTITDAHGRPFTSGSVNFSQNGRILSGRVAIDGSFRFDDLAPGPYSLSYSVASGWLEGSLSGVLGGGANTAPIATAATAAVTGTAILVRDPAAKPAVSFVYNQKTRSVSLNASGDFVLDPVPVNTPFQMVLSYGSIRRTENFNVGDDSALGSFYLDTTAPLIAFANNGGTLDSLPYDLDFSVSESDPQSAWDGPATRVWVNNREITSLFTRNANGLGAHLESLPDGFVLGSNQLRVEARNQHGAIRQSDFSLQVSLSGVTLVVRLKQGSTSASGQVRLADGGWTNTNAAGSASFSGVLPGAYTLKGRSANGGKRQRYTVTQEINQYLDLSLAAVGTYSGRVLDINAQPAAQALVTIGDQQESADSQGNYVFDLLPLGSHHLLAQQADYLGYRAGANLATQGQVVSGQDITLAGAGSVAGFVYDDDGSTPIVGARVRLRFTGLPDSFDKESVSAADGSFAFSAVMARALRLEVTHAASGRVGSADGLLEGHGTQLALNVLLNPAGNLSAVVLDASGDPVAGLAVRAVGGGFTFNATTASDGRLSILNMPFSSYHLSAEYGSAFQYLSQDIVVDQDELDLGNLSLVVDQLPTISNFAMPAVYDLATQAAVHLTLSDDRQVQRYRIVYSGVYQADITRYIYNVSYDANIAPALPTTAAEGLVNWDLYVYDQLGQVSHQNGSTTLVWGGSGPALTITQPLNGTSLIEGVPLEIRATASDPSGIASVHAQLADADLGDDLAAPYSWSSYAPGVEQTTNVALVVTATNKRGQSVSLRYDLVVNPIESAGGPSIDLLSPLPGVALPLSLPAGLNLRFVAQLSDEDGLESADLRLNGNSVRTVNLSGTSALLDQTYTLPAALRDQTDLLAELIVRDQGGNPAVAIARIVNLPLDANSQVADSVAPISLRDWDVSLDGKTLVLAGGTHIIDGLHQFEQLVLVNGAVLTQTATANSPLLPAYTELQLDGDLVLDYGCRINADQKGYGAMPPGFGYSGWRASHGGLGSGTSDLRLLYGSPFQPRMPGANNGGGAVHISAHGLWLAGDISADGRNNGQSSGGSVWLSASQYSGKGRISANAYTGTYSSGPSEGGGGGRVAIYGPYSGSAQAFGGKSAGAGTVYYRSDDSSRPRGFRDRLVVANAPEASTTNYTALRSLHDKVVDSDLTSTLVTQDNETRQVLSYLETLPQDSFIGMYAYKNGELGQFGQIQQQTATALRSAHLGSFSSFTDGDLVQVDYLVDELIIGHQGSFHLQDVPPTSPLHVSAFAQLTLGSAPMNLTSSALTLEDGATLIGQVQLDQFTWSSGTLNFDGSLSTSGEIVIASGATVRTPAARSDAQISLDAPRIQVDGSLLAQNNPSTLNPGSTYDSSHGGMGGALDYATRKTYGSLYAPQENGRSGQAGGALVLSFDQLELAGTLDVSGFQAGSAGSILLRGHGSGASLSGAGHLRALGSTDTNSYRAGGGGRIAVLVDDISGFSGDASALGGRYPATPNDPFHQAGAGTIFYRTTTWPNGRLVLDNGGKVSPAGSTLLPGLGVQTAAVDGSGTQLAASNLPLWSGLTGLQVVFPNGDTRTVLGNDASTLNLDSEMPALLAGESFHGRHLLDQLEVRGNARLRSIDEIVVSGAVVLEQGSIDAPLLSLPLGSPLQNGTIELHANPGLSGDLELDNFHLIAHFPLDLTSLHLINGATLVSDQNLSANSVTLDNGSLTLTGTLEADQVQVNQGTLSLTGTLNGSEVVVNDGFVLNGTVNTSGLFQVNGSGRVTTPVDVLDGYIAVNADQIEIAGQMAALRNPGSLDPAGVYTYNHGGFGGNRDLATTKTYGTLYRPTTNGRGSQAGGHIQLNFATSLNLTGTLDAHGSGQGSGGSILLEGPAISGGGALNVNGGNASNGGGGGHIAVLVEDLSNYTGQVTAFGGFYSNTYPANNGGAGTIFYRNSSWPHGRLIVDNNGTESRPGSTFLPSLGQRTAAVASPAGNVLAGENFPDLNGLLGLYAVFASGDLVALSGNSPFELQSQGFPALAQGETYSGRHILDILEIRGKGNLKTDDGIHVLVDFVQGQGSVVSPDLKVPVEAVLANGSIEYFEDPGFTRLELDNFQLTVHFPMNLTRLVLNNGSILTTDADLDADIVTVNNGQIVSSAVVRGDNLTLSDAGVIRTPENRADAGLTLDFDTLAIHGTVRAYRNPLPGTYQWYDTAHGGHSGVVELSQSTTYGSLYQPDSVGKGPTAGGKLMLLFRTMELTGSINADGSGRASGGSVLVQGQTLSGSGAISASGGSDTYAGGGGHVAVLVENLASYSGAVTARGGFPNSNSTYTGGAGTVFYRNSTWPHGRLVVENNNRVNRAGNTELPGLGQRSVSVATGGAVIEGSGFSVPNSLVGLYAAFEHGEEVEISANSATQLSGVSAFPTLAAGDSYSGLHILDTLEVYGMGQLKTADAIRVLGNLVVQDGSIDSPKLTLPPGFQFTGGKLELFQDPGLENLTLDNFQLTVHFPLQLGQLILRNGATLTSDRTILADQVDVQSGNIYLNGSLTAQSLHLAAGTSLSTPVNLANAKLHINVVQLDIEGSIVANRNPLTYFPSRPWYDTAHGGHSGVVELNQSFTYGSFYVPQTNGKGDAAGGAIELSFTELNLTGVIQANGIGRAAGGSVLLIGDRLIGTGSIKADGGNDTYAGGGGHVSLHMTDLSQFTGQVSAFGGFASNSTPNYNGGAGTVFYLTPTWPNGRLVIDNNNQANRAGSTELPGLGERSTSEATDGGSIRGTGFPAINSLKGMTIVFPGGETSRVGTNNETELYPDGAFPALAAGEHYHGLHVLDVLEVRGQGRLRAIDPIQVLESLIVDNGTIDVPSLEIPPSFVFSNGQMELFQDPGLTELTLDNYKLVTHFPLNLSQLTLRNGASLESDRDIQAAVVSIPSGTLILNGKLSGDSLDLAAGSVMRTPENVANAGLLLDFANMNLAGAVQALKNPTNAFAGRPWYDTAHAGKSGVVELNQSGIYGSLYFPRTNGKGDTAGGRLELHFDTLNLSGSLSAAGSYRAAGGSVLLIGSTLNGVGSISVNGGNDTYAGGGGHLALHVENLAGYTGTVSALGGFANNSTPNYNGGAGTIFYRNSTWPNGRLVVNNGDHTNRVGSTELSGLGVRSVAAASGGASIEGTGFLPLESLSGLHVRFADDSLVAIASNTTTSLTPEGSFPVLAAGDSYSGQHVFDVLEIKGKANLTCIDGIRVLDSFVLESGSINSPNLEIPTDGVLQNGSIELFEDPGYAYLELDNFHLTVHYPLDLDHITLINGATLTSDASITAAGQVNVLSGSLTMNGTLSAASLTVSAGASLRTLPNVVDSHIVADVPVINIAGQVIAQATRGDNPSNIYRSSHGGLGGGFDFATAKTLGSFYEPATSGRDSGNTLGGGGYVRFNFTSMELGGSISANGILNGAGGSVVLAGSSLSGLGSVSANGVNTTYAGGGGRVAILVDDISAFAGATSAFGGQYSNGTTSYYNGGAGTVFFRTSAWPNGRLVVDNNGLVTRWNSTPLPGLGTLTLASAVNGDTLPASGLPAFDGLKGAYLVLPDLSEVAIIASTATSLTLAQPVSLAAGDQVKLVHVLDVLEVRGNANLQSIDAIRVHQGGIFNMGSIAAPKLSLLESYSLTNGSITLFVDPEFSDLTLENFQLTMRAALATGQLNLINAVLTPYGDVSATQVSIDATSKITVKDEGNSYNPSNRYRSSLGGYGGGFDFTPTKTLGSLYRPTTTGRGDGAAAGAGGFLHLVFDHMNLQGSLDVNGSGTTSGGSILLEGQSLEGSGSILANGGNTTYAGGGGRIALLIEDIADYNGAVSAIGGIYSNGSNNYYNGGAGTVFYRTGDWPNGRLVVDNNGKPTRVGSTSLPSLGQLTLASAVNGNTISASGLPALGGLTGLYVILPNGDEVAVVDNSETTLVLERSVALNAGQVLNAVHVLDVLEVRGGANLRSADKLRVLQSFDFANGSVEAPVLDLPEGSTLANGSATLYVDPGLRDLTLDHFDLTIRAPFSLDRLVMQSSTLTTYATLSATEIEVDALSTIRSRDEGNSVNPSNLYRSSHGGLGGGFDFTNTRTFDSLYYPSQNGRGDGAAAGSGGAVHLQFGSLLLNGTIEVKGSTTNSGGAILLEGQTLSGNGIISANGGDTTYAAGGGRVAVLVDNISAWAGVVSAIGGQYSNGTNAYYNAGAGTIFYRTSQYPNGKLVLDNNGKPTRFASTPLPSLGSLTLSAAVNGQDIAATGLPALGGLKGMSLILPDASEVVISANTATNLHLDAPVVLAAGDKLHAVHILDVLEVRGGANLKTADRIRVLQDYDFQGGAIEAAALELPHGNFHNGNITLFTQPSTLALDLLNFDLTTRGPFQITSLQLVNSTLRPMAVFGAQSIDVDATSSVTAIDEGNSYNPSSRYRSSHGGYGGGFEYGSYQTYGSFHYPTNSGRGTGSEAGAGGFVHLSFETLNLAGKIEVNGATDKSAGSILLEGNALTGAGVINANGGNTTYAGGGGRIALLVANSDDFSGSVNAYGGIYSNGSNSYYNGGAGTVFYRSTRYPNGRLVVDNRGYATRFASTTLPSLGTLTLATAVQGNAISGSAFPALGGLVGLYLKLPDSQEVAVTGNGETSIDLASSVDLASGSQLKAVHVLDALEVRGGANLKTLDELRVLERFDFQGGTVDTPKLSLPEGSVLANGSATFFVDPGIQNLTLDNFQLTSRVPLNIDSLTLNNATLTLYGPVTARAIEIGAGSVVRARSEGGDYNPSNRFRSSHGGFGGGFEFASYQTLGSFYQPTTNGRGNNGDPGAGGHVELHFDSLLLEGSIDVNGSTDRSGGSILLQGNELSGGGSIRANGGDTTYASGGGRIALLIEDLVNYSGQVSAYGGIYSTGTNNYYNGGAGTVFTRNSTWPNGKLSVINRGFPTRPGSTQLPGLGTRTLSAASAGGTTLNGTGFPALAGLSGMKLVQGEYEIAITGNSETELQLASALPPLPAGESYQGLHVLDELEVKGAANLKSLDSLRILQNYNVDAGSLVDAPNIDLPSKTQLPKPVASQAPTRTIAADSVGQDRSFARGETLLTGNFHYRKLSLQPGAQLTINGSLQVDDLDLWRAQLLIKSVPGDSRPALRARNLRLRESQLAVDHLAVTQSLNLDSESALKPAAAKQLKIHAGQAQLDGTLAVAGGTINLETAQLYANGGRVQGRLEITGGNWLSVNLHLEHLVSTGPLFLAESMLHLTSLRAPHLYLERGSELHPSRGPSEPVISLDIAETLMVDATSSVRANGDARLAGAPAHGGLAYGEGQDRNPDLRYGSPVFPERAGQGLSGGGVISISASDLQLDGQLSARGEQLSAGGSILIRTKELRGSGSIDVRGGKSDQAEAGGGRVAIHAAARHRFNGQIQTGTRTETMGTLVLEEPGQDAVTLSSELTPTGLKPAQPSKQIHLEAESVTNTATSPEGLVLHLKTEQNLNDTLGLWLNYEGQTYRVRSVAPLQKDTYLIQLQGFPTWRKDKPLDFILKTATHQIQQ